MTSTKPYLIRALYEWILDNGLTPHVIVEVKDERVRVPMQFVKDGAIVLNLSPSAVRDLSIGNEFVSFSARFSGVAHSIIFPVAAARMIFARENGRGMELPDDQEQAGPDSPASQPGGSTPGEEPPPQAPPPRGGHLRRVK